jgi:hypothetical protein
VVVAIPYEALVGVAVIVVFGSAVAWLAAPMLAARYATGRSRGIRVVIGVVLAILVVATAGLRAAGAPLAPSDQPLQYGHAYGGDDPRLLSIGRGPGTQYMYAYAPGAEIRTGITLANDGDVPLTVTGLEPASIPNVRSIELRLSPGAPTQDLLPVYPNEGSDRWSSEPFHPVEIPAHGEIGLGLAVTIGVCPGAPTRPTLAPGASLLPESDPSLGGVMAGIGELHIRYSAFGVARTAIVTMPFSMVVVGQPNVTGCAPA